MNKLELDQIKDISKSIEYESPLPVNVSMDKISDFKKISASLDYDDKKVIQEETYDDFDTVYEALRAGVDLEINHFVGNLLANNVANFMWVFMDPKTEVFKDAWNHALNKFTLRDQSSQDQFLERIRILFRNIFLEKFKIPNQDDAVALADAYSEVFKLAINQNLDKMKSSDGQTIDTAQNYEKEQGDELTYR